MMANVMNLLLPNIIGVFIVFDLAIVTVCDYKDTYYGDTNMWKNDYPECDGERQSPIRISYQDAMYDNSLGNLSFVGYDEAFQDATYSLINTGASVMAGIDGRNAYILGGGLLSRYLLWNIHFHWGSNDSQGCEHVMEGVQCSGELHFVHVKEEYLQFDDRAVADPSAVAVIGVILQCEASAANHTGYENIVQELQNVRDADAYSLVQPFALKDLLPQEPSQFFRYDGSLTTKPCYENVVWTVLRNPVILSIKQMDAFRLLYADGASTKMLADNFRPILPLGDRQLNTNFAMDNAVTSHIPHDGMVTEAMTTPSPDTSVATTEESVHIPNDVPNYVPDDGISDGNADCVTVDGTQDGTADTAQQPPCDSDDSVHTVQVQGSGGFSIFQFFQFFIGGQ